MENIDKDIARTAIVLNDFETSLEESNWHWRIFNADGARGGSGYVSINYDERYVKTGDASLRIDYDFASQPVNDTVTLEVGPKEGYGVLAGEPRAIGMWVYGDGSGAWLRSQLKVGVYVGDTYVDWLGWKYIETPIPAKAQLPYELHWGVRILAIPDGQVNGKKGTIYIDQLRIIYDSEKSDLLAPELQGEATPFNAAVGVQKDQKISLIVKDPTAEGQVSSGINLARTYFKINGISKTNFKQTIIEDYSVKIEYVPTKGDYLRSGENWVRVRVEDNAGNKLFQEWSFNVEGYNVELVEIVPDEEIVVPGSSFDYAVTAKSYKNFKDLELELSYEKNSIKLNGVIIDERVSITKQEHEPELGLIKCTLSDMYKFKKGETPLIKFNFITASEQNGQTGITVNKAIIRELNRDENVDLALAGYNKEIAYPYVLTYSGGTVNESVSFSVKDIKSNPIAGVNLLATNEIGKVIELGKTNEQGNLLRENLLSRVGELYIISGFKQHDQELFNPVEIITKASLGTSKPDKIVITTSEDPSQALRFSWETNTEIEYSNLEISSVPDMSNTIIIPAKARKVSSILNGDRVSKFWQAACSELMADTEYYYRVGYGEELSAVKRFKTTSSDINNIAVFGDLQGKYEVFPEVYSRLYNLNQEIDINLIAGDVADTGNSYSDWERIAQAWSDVEKITGKTGIWSSAVGNHDAISAAEIFTAYFNGPQNGSAKLAYDNPKGSSRNYFFKLANAIVYNFDTEAYFDYDPEYKLQLERMKEVFAVSQEDFKIVLMHRSVYPMNYNEDYVRDLAPQFEQLGVDLVLSGHDHIYSRTRMQGGVKSETGVTYVVTGTSTGGKFYNVDKNGRPWQDVVYDRKNPVFIIISIKDKNLSLQAYAVEDSETILVDEFTIMKN